MFSAKVRNGLASFVGIVREGRRMSGELKDVVEAIVDRAGLVQAFRAEGTMEAESRAENIQEFLGVAAEFEETHEDIEGTLESLEELRAAGISDLPAGAVASGEASAVPAQAAAPAARDERDASDRPNPLDALAAPLTSAQEALATMIAGNSMAAAPVEPLPAVLVADEIERTYGPLACAALPRAARVARAAQRPGCAVGAGERHHDDDGALGEGPGVPRGVRRRHGGGHLPARGGLRGGRRPGQARGGAPPGIRRHHPRAQAPVLDLCGDAPHVRLDAGQPALAFR